MAIAVEMSNKEKIVVSSILFNKEVREFALEKEVFSDWFQTPMQKRIMQAFNAYAKTGIEPTESLIISHLSPKTDEDRAKLVHILDNLKQSTPPEPREAVEIHIGSLKRSFLLRNYEKVVSEFQKKIQKLDPQTVNQDQLNKLERELESLFSDVALVRADAENKAMDFIEGFKLVLQKMKEALASKTNEEFITTGYLEMDLILNGGFPKGYYSIIAGRPGMGKTVMMLNNCIEAARSGARVLFISIEMNLLQCFQRLVSKVSDVSSKRIQQPKYLEPNDKTKLEKSGKEIFGLYGNRLWIEEVNSLTVAQLERTIKKYKKEHNIDIVYVDYAQIMLTKEGNEPEQASDYAQISNSLRRVSKAQNVAVVVGSQLSRDLEKRPDKRPIMADIRNSGAFEQDAAAIIGLYRDEVYTKEACEKPDILEVIFIKNRFGAMGSVDFKYDLDKQAVLGQAV
jgi:replicative DNA helicase